MVEGAGGDATARTGERYRRVVTVVEVMTTESLATVKATLSEVVDRVERYHERVVISRRGREAAVILSPEEVRSLEETIAVVSDPETLQRLQEADAAIADGCRRGSNMQQLRPPRRPIRTCRSAACLDPATGRKSGES